ncbi:hypothetical protein [Enemella evansiae]|uniref:hypothetical protein n=1 Tax=Enemella evansiae TaxID=2016499 RepID=UPI0011800747|nr:hypothetical protein [Enemella evansiae]
MSSWRYVATKVRDADAGIESWEVRELYSEEGGRFSYTAGPTSPVGDDLAELIRDLTNMAADARLPWLDLTGDEPHLVDEPPDVITR